MAILKAGAISTTFDLDGKEYSKGLYKAIYSNVITLEDGSSDETKLEVGLRNINTGETIQEPIMIRAWKNGSDVAYTTLDSLITDLASVAGLGSSGGSGFNPGQVWSSYALEGLQFKPDGAVDLDFAGFGDASKLVRYSTGVVTGLTYTSIKNVSLLTNLEDRGTAPSLFLVSSGLTAETIDDVFTQLPATTKTATIDVRSNPGSATCDTSIATTKGYTVVTA